MEILSSGLQVRMAEQDLNRTQIRTRLEQMRGPAMAQGVRRYMLSDARMEGSFFTGIPDGPVRDGSILAALTYAAREKIDARLLPAPILAQRFQQGRAEWEVSTGATLAALHPDHHAPAVDIAHL